MLHIGTVGRRGHWTGVVRRDGPVRLGGIIVNCGHVHPNRDVDSTNRTSARRCIAWAVKAAQTPEVRIYVPAYVTPELIAKVAAVIGRERVDNLD